VFHIYGNFYKITVISFWFIEIIIYMIKQKGVNVETVRNNLKT